MPRTKQQQARERIQALDDRTLATLAALLELLGQRRTWPSWAHAALAGTSPAASARTEFNRLLRRAWPRVGWQTHQALRVIAGALDVPLPAAGMPRAAPRPGVPRRRTLWPGPSPGAAPDGSPSTVYDGAGGTPDAEPAQQEPAAADADDDAEVRERMRRHNNQPGVWQPASSLSEAIHDEERGWF